jgi:hypothetical protein
MEYVFYDAHLNELIVISNLTWAANMLIISHDPTINVVGLEFLGHL